MNTIASSDLQRPLTAGSVESFRSGVAGATYFTLNGLPWHLTSASLLFKDPDGNETSVAATSSDGLTWTAVWTVPDTPGAWARAWSLRDAVGNVQISQVLQFRVIDSPFGQ